ncbi:fibropellin-3-like [Mya arenaria]|uniref:fibropellin-3-like n=1 Tax=Mya arenaria TaxID=6604 RepID=UPI0022E75958|nr:fibropellin-3-like [Mya arenaria]
MVKTQDLVQARDLVQVEDVDVNECASFPCANGVCSDHVGYFTCSCFPGYTGTCCAINIDDCQSGPCLNGGLCKDGVNSYTCTCRRGYTGDNCQTDTNECVSSPCRNGGTCFDNAGFFSCVCPAGYTGTRCEIETNECASNPCRNNGLCTDLPLEFNCTCPVLFTGLICEIGTVAFVLTFPADTTVHAIRDTQGQGVISISTSVIPSPVKTVEYVKIKSTELSAFVLLDMKEHIVKLTLMNVNHNRVEMVQYAMMVSTTIRVFVRMGLLVELV